MDIQTQIQNNPEEATATDLVKAGIKKGVSGSKPRIKRAIVLLITFALGVVVGRYVLSSIKYNNISNKPNVSDTVPRDDFTLTISHVEGIVDAASDLITTKYRYKDADTYENHKSFFNIKLPATTNRAVFTYRGIVHLGIDLSDVSYDINNLTKTICVTLPDIEIKSNEILPGSFEYVYQSTSIFNSFKFEDATELMSTLTQQKAEEVMNDKALMEETKKNTETVIRNLLHTSDLTKDYTITFE